MAQTVIKNPHALQPIKEESSTQSQSNYPEDDRQISGSGAYNINK
tara:strand:- start:660 stop:794 length:135 start_codon:yes stop_codon:yes gene_type:complete